MAYDDSAWEAQWAREEAAFAQRQEARRLARESARSRAREDRRYLFHRDAAGNAHLTCQWGDGQCGGSYSLAAGRVEWGYDGEGPREAAIALLMDAEGIDRATAYPLSRWVVEQFIAELVRDFNATVQVREVRYLYLRATAAQRAAK